MTTTTKSNFLILSVFLIISILTFVFTFREKQTNFSYKIFKTEIGWGYDILSGRNVIIHQKEVPAIPVIKGFDNKEQAIAAAQLVIRKIKNGQPPAIGIFELGTIMPEMDIAK